MNLSAMYSFLDAYGNTGLETKVEGTSVYFIVAAVLVKHDQLESARAKVEQVRVSHFQTGEMKSSTVGNNINRRLQILADLNKVEFQVHVDAIDKREIGHDSGLIYGRSFLKHLHQQLYRKLVRAFPDIRVLADEHGSRDFMDGFERYIAKKNPPSLFPQAAFGFIDSRDERLVQLADFIAGSLARVIDPDKISDGSDLILDTIGPKILTFDEWPPLRRLYQGIIATREEDMLDSLIEDTCLDQALMFIEENQEPSDSMIQLQIATIRYLVFHSRFIEPTQYVTTNELLAVLLKEGFPPMSEQYFRSSVIAKLRDAGVIIASGQRGYKLPVSAQDLLDLVTTVSNIVLPMIDRLKRARDHIKRVSEGKLDILSRDELRDLRVICNGKYRGADS